MSIGIGEALRDAREEQGGSIEDAARDTRVRADYLRALEDEQFDVFGGDVYAKGFLSTYARYLRLDPQPLLDSYRRHVESDTYDTTALVTNPVTRQPSRPPPPWLAWTVVVVIVLAGVGALAQFGGRTPAPADRQGPTATSAASPSPRASARPSPTPSPTPTYEGVEVILAFEQRSWTVVRVDGTTVLEQTVEQGETRRYQGQEEIEITFGNAGGVRVERNGEDLGTQGAQGEVRTVTFTPDGVRSE